MLGGMLFNCAPFYVWEKQLSSSGFSLAAIKIPGYGNLYSRGYIGLFTYLGICNIKLYLESIILILDPSILEFLSIIESLFADQNKKILYKYRQL